MHETENTMQHVRTVTILSVFIMIAAGIAAAVGIFSSDGPGPYTYIIPTTAVVTIICATLMLRGLKSSEVPN